MTGGTGSGVRYLTALAGPILSAGAQFLLSLVLLRILDDHAFGRLSILLIVIQLGWGIWTALFCAPMPILLNRANPAAVAAVERALLSANMLCCACGFAVVAATARMLGEDNGTALLFGGYGAVSLLRWFARAHGYAIGQPLRTTASDTIYALVLLAGVGWMAATGLGSMRAAAILLLLGAVAGMPAFGGSYLSAQFLRIRLRHAGGYPAVWREHGRWSLLGVVTTEATANAHSYLVTLLRGPAAFAPIAAAGLMIRPITVAMNALGEFERARLARHLGPEGAGDTGPTIRLFRLVLVAAWIATAIAIVVLLGAAPWLIFPPRYAFGALAIGAALWMLVAFVRLMRMPESTLLQAAGAFRPLAMASLWSSGLSIVAVLALLFLATPLWSIVGVLGGEALFAMLVWREARRLANRRPLAQATPHNDPVIAGEAETLECRV
jgi:hypothetical protein